MGKRFRILRHVLLVLLMCIIALNYATPYEQYGFIGSPIFVVYFIGLIFTYLLPAYFNFYFLIPRYLRKKKYLAYFSILLIVILIMLLAQFVLEYYAYQAMEIFPEPTYDLDDKLILVFDFLGNYFLNLIAFIGCSVTLLFRYWISDSQRAGQLASEQLKTEVEYLKEQVDPNFLFNTLNRIGRLGEIDPSQASAMLLIFSKLLRYQLYDCRRQEVFLTSEIKFLHDYLCLEQLYYEKMEFTITLEGDVASVLVPPLLFIPFVREQIKGIEKRDTYATFLLHFNANDQTLQFTTTGDTQIKSFSPDFRFITKRLALLFGNNYNLQYLSPPFIIPEGHCLRLSLPQTDQL